jgi:type II secretory ATPase GspE/PulE/Tfp pilus assembly ATPase PilB-like protein
MLEIARKNGFKTMKDDGLIKVERGITTPSEVMRSVYSL